MQTDKKYQRLQADKRTKAGGFWKEVENAVEWLKLKTAGEALRVVLPSGKYWNINRVDERVTLNALPSK